MRLRNHRTVQRIATPLLAMGMVFMLPDTPHAHEVPADVAVQAYVHPAGSTFTVLVRVPLVAMRDVQFPLRGPGYLELSQVAPYLEEGAALWIAGYLEIFEGDVSLGDERIVATRVSLPSDRSFASFESAMAHVRGPGLPVDTEIFWQQALLDVLMEVPITSEEARFSIDPRLAHLGVETLSVIHFVLPNGAERAFQYRGNPGLVHLDPRWHQAVLRFVKLGFFHILDGLDHLLFVLLLVVPFRRIRPLVSIITGFTVGHSITLIASAVGMTPTALWFPAFIETLIALSIVYMALENIVGAKVGRRWVVAFAFGLIHGFGFAFVLQESLQFAGGHLVTSLLSFNLGVELGQLFVLAFAIPALVWLFRRVVAERVGTIIISVLVAHTAWHWMTERGGQLLQYDLRGPAMDTAFLGAGMRWVILALVCLGVGWSLSGVLGRLARSGEQPDTAPPSNGR